MQFFYPDGSPVIHEGKAFGIPDFARSTPHPERRRLLEFAQARRNAGERPATLKDENGETWGFGAMLIPELDYRVIVAAIPELNSKDEETYHRAWRKFLASDLGRKYCLDDSIGRRKPNSRIIVK